jgi:hypothetical protein
MPRYLTTLLILCPLLIVGGTVASQHTRAQRPHRLNAAHGTPAPHPHRTMAAS